MGLHGKLDSFALEDVLQVLSLRRMSGTMRVDGDRAQGAISLMEGTPVRAEMDSGESGEAAFFLLLENCAGEFTFVQDESARTAETPLRVDRESRDSSRISRSLDVLLLELADRLEG